MTIFALRMLQSSSLSFLLVAWRGSIFPASGSNVYLAYNWKLWVCVFSHDAFLAWIKHTRDFKNSLVVCPCLYPYITSGEEVVFYENYSLLADERNSKSLTSIFNIFVCFTLLETTSFRSLKISSLHGTHAVSSIMI